MNYLRASQVDFSQKVNSDAHMPKKGKTVLVNLPDREVEICERFREIRKFKQWTQIEYAKELGITRDRVASYEYARAPVKYSVGMMACVLSDFSPRWLAEGTRPPFGCIYSSDGPEDGVGDNQLFSQVYDKYLKEIYLDSSEEYVEALLKEIGVENGYKLMTQAWFNTCAKVDMDPTFFWAQLAMEASNFLRATQPVRGPHISWKDEYLRLLEEYKSRNTKSPKTL